eukprot:scaffold9553_cov114-Isochrysis_galbana.AAC.20
MYPCMPLVAARSGTSSAAKAKNSTGVGRCCGSTAERNWLRWSPLKCSTIGRSAPAACSSGWARHASVSAEVPPAGRENHGQSASCSPRAVSSDARRQRSLLVQRATSASVEHSPSRSAPSASSHAAPSRSHSPARWRQWAKASLSFVDSLRGPLERSSSTASFQLHCSCSWRHTAKYSCAVRASLGLSTAGTSSSPK